MGATSEEEVLFQSSRIGWAGLSYKNTSLANGNYNVTLGFAETHHNTAGARIFDVKIEGNLVLDDFDIYDAAGGRNVALKRVFPITLTDGTLNIDLTTVVDASKISFIKVTKAAVDVLDSSIRMNVGGQGSGGTNTGGAYFLSDDSYLVGAASRNASFNPTTRQDQTYSGIETVTPSDEIVYQTERYGSEFGYAIPVRNGRYRIRLMFSELFHTNAGKRGFEISIEGSVVPVAVGGETMLDIYARAGGQNKALDLFYEVDVQDQVLNIGLNSQIDNASIAGIVVTPYYLKKNVRLQNGKSTSDVPVWMDGYRDDQL